MLLRACAPAPLHSTHGLRLVLTAGVPGAPWTEAAKGVFEVKKIPFQRVAQRPLRKTYSNSPEQIRASIDPALLEHRDFIYRTYLTLPIDT